MQFSSYFNKTYIHLKLIYAVIPQPARPFSPSATSHLQKSDALQPPVWPTGRHKNLSPDVQRNIGTMLRRITEHDDPDLLRILPLQPRLEAQDPTGAGLPNLRVGRHPNNDLVLTSVGIPLLLSRQHALITYDGEQFTLVDLDTTNGTYVNTIMLPRNGRRVLRPGDTVSFGGPTTVLREGIHLRNPFRYRFELWSPVVEAVQQVPPPTAAVTGRRRGRAEVEAEAPSDALPAQRTRVVPPPRRASARLAGRNLPTIAEGEPAGPPPVVEAVVAAPPPPPPPAVPELPPLPTFEPRTVAPLQGTTLLDVTARMATDCECGVCRDIMVAPHALACGHTFCGSCIMMWVRRRAICPMCRARSGKPVYVRALDDLILAIAEPQMNAEDMAERQTRKLEWQTMQVEFAREARETDLQRASAAAAAAAAPGGAARMPYSELQRMLRQSTLQLQNEMRTLQERFATAGGEVGPPLRALAAARPSPLLDAEAPSGDVAWSVECALNSRTVCHTCFTGIPEGTVRVIRTLAAPTEATSVRDFHHLTCCTPRCPPLELRGLALLREEDRQRVNERMANAAAQAAADLQAAAVEPAVPMAE